LIDSDLRSPSSSYGERTERVKQLKRAADQLHEEKANMEDESAKETEMHNFEMEQLEKEKQELKDTLQTKRTALKESANERVRLNVTIKGLQGGDFKARVAELHTTIAKLEKELKHARVLPPKSTFDLLNPKSPVFEDEIVHRVGEINKRQCCQESPPTPPPPGAASSTAPLLLYIGS
jgi:seryl-tRNA synthetase